MKKWLVYFFILYIERLREQNTMIMVEKIGMDIHYDERLLMGIYPSISLFSETIISKTAELGVDLKIDVNSIVGLQPIKIDFQQYFVLCSMFQLLIKLNENPHFVPIKEFPVFLSDEIRQRKIKLEKRVWYSVVV